jgi:hypothetical protein
VPHVPAWEYRTRIGGGAQRQLAGA